MTISPQWVVEQLDQAPDVLTWLNQTLPSSDSTGSLPGNNGAPLDALLTATSIAAQSTSSALENTIDEIARSTSRLAYDLHFTRDAVLALRGVVAHFAPQTPSNDAATVSPDTTSSVLEKLRYLDTIKLRMEAARDVLRETESWGALEAEVSTLLADKAYARAAARLSASAKLMPIARTAPTYTPQEPRRALLTSLANQLEAAVSPDLVRAITNGDVELCKSLYAVFVDIDRETEFRNYYYGIRRSHIVETWNRAVLEGESPPTANADQQPVEQLGTFYPTFLSSFLSTLNAERACLPSIFPDPEITLVSLIYNTLNGLMPSPSQRFAALFHGSGGAAALREIVKLFRATEDFAKGTERILEKLRVSGPPIMSVTSSSPNEGKLSRRRSARMSLSWRSTSSVSGAGRSLAGQPSGTSMTPGGGVDGTEWDQYLFQPFLDFQVDFGVLERRLLDEMLGSPTSSLKESLDSDHAARVMRERAVDVFSLAEESIERCMIFTHGYASVGLVHALDGCISNFVEGWTSYVADLAGAHPGSVPGTLSFNGTEDDAFADLDYTTQDWMRIQGTMHLLAAARAVKERLGVLETRLKGALNQVAMSFRNAENGLYTPGVTRGEGLLLAQSTLNSADLRELLSLSEESKSSGPSPRLLSSAYSAIRILARTTQRTLQHVLLSPLFVHLSTYASLPLWSAARTLDPVRGLGGVSIPTFSLGPSEAIHRVGDGLLSLPRLFEVYAEDDALAFEIGTLTSSNDDHGPSPSQGDTGSTAGQKLFSPEAVTAAWLSCLGRTMVIHLTKNVLPQIRTLSVAGSTQLAADLSHLSTIVRALGAEEGELQRWRTYVSMKDEEGQAMTGAAEDRDEILARVAKMRGWTT